MRKYVLQQNFFVEDKIQSAEILMNKAFQRFIKNRKQKNHHQQNIFTQKLFVCF